MNGVCVVRVPVHPCNALPLQLQFLISTFAVPPFRTTGSVVLQATTRPALYQSDIVLPVNYNTVQPFVHLGAATPLVEHVMTSLTMGRMCPYYLFNSMQNAHMLVPVYACATSEEAESDPLHQLLKACGRTLDASVDALEALVPGYLQTLTTQQVPLPSWLSKNTSGVYGALHNEVFSAAHAQQGKVAAVSSLVCPPQATLPTTLVSVATVQLENPEPGFKLRYMTKDEQQTAYLWCSRKWEEEVQACVIAEPPMPLREQPHKAALLRHVLAARAATDGPLLVSRRHKACGDLVKDPLTTKAWDLTGTFLHLTAVVAHPDAPSSGEVALRKVCRVADDMQLPLLLEALPSQLLPTYYARFGFRLCSWDNKPCVESTFERQGLVYMWRAATQQATGVDKRLLSSAQIARLLDLVWWNAQEQALGRRMFVYNRKPNKLEALHLSVEANARAVTRLVWMLKKDTANNRLSMPFCWASEYVTQMEQHSWTTQPIALPAEPLPPWVPTPNLRTASALAVRSRSTTGAGASSVDSDIQEVFDRSPVRQRARTVLSPVLGEPTSFHAPVAVHSSPLRHMHGAPLSVPLGTAGSYPGLGPNAVPVLYIANFTGSLYLNWNASTGLTIGSAVASSTGSS